MDYEYYFIIYNGVYTYGSEAELTSMQLGSKEDLSKIHSDAMESWEAYEGDGDVDPQTWDRSHETDATVVLGRGNNLETLTKKFYEAIKEKLGYNWAN
jgi:hypothetical protein